MKKLVAWALIVIFAALMTGCALNGGPHYGDYRQGEPAIPDEWAWPSENAF